MLGAKERQSNEDGIRRRLANSPYDFDADVAVSDAIEPFQRADVVKHQIGDECPIDRLVVAKYGIAERVAHRLPGGFARLSNGARDVVSVDDRETSNGEVFRRRRLTRPDAAGDDNSLHACTLATTCHTSVPEATLY